MPGNQFVDFIAIIIIIFLTNHALEVSLTGNTSTSVNRKLHLADLLVDVLHELDDEVDELVLEHGLGMGVGDEEADVEVGHLAGLLVLVGDGLPSEDEEVLCSLGKEAHEPLRKDVLKNVFF